MSADSDSRLPVPLEISREQLEKVIHRAAELQSGRGESYDTLDVEEVQRIAEEVGLEGRHVRQALAELRADALMPSRPEDRSLATRLWGEATVVESRVVPGEPEEVQEKLRSYLTDRESLRCVRDRPGQQVWEPASDLMSQLQRNLDFSGRGYELAKTRTLTVLTQPLEEGRTLVSVVADLSNTRAGYAAGWYGGIGVFALGTALGAVLGENAAAYFVFPGVATGVAIVGTIGTAKTLARRRERVTLSVQGLLDRLERDSGFATDRPTLRERITELLE
ncbi:MAG: hypothetical protein M8866_04185 [marine benthic group bacterium]|nr:hypothetical protein [Candidatus Benthicola marisminoris]